MIETFNPDKIKAITSEQKRAGNVNYTSVKFDYDGDKMPPLRIDGKFKLFRFKGLIYSLSINCNEELEVFFENLCDFIVNETCRLVPRLIGKKLYPESFELVKTSKNGRNVYAKIYTKPSGRAKCKVSASAEVDPEESVKNRAPIQLEELIDESFEGSCILRLYHVYLGSTKSITLSVEEILVTERKTSNSYFDDE